MTSRRWNARGVVRRVEEAEKTAGGIIIPDTAKEKPQEGEVVAVGPGARDEQGKLQPLDVKAGDRVLFGKWSGTEADEEGADHRADDADRADDQRERHHRRAHRLVREDRRGPPPGREWYRVGPQPTR